MYVCYLILNQEQPWMVLDLGHHKMSSFNHILILLLYLRLMPLMF